MFSYEIKLCIFCILVQVSESSNDPQKASNYGHSDRRGIINKSTKVFTRQELREMLKKLKDDGPQNIPLLSTTGTRSSEGIFYNYIKQCE